MTDAARAAQAHGFELSLADATLASERARVQAEAQACPSAERQPLAVSVGDRVRDGIRLQASDDQARLVQVAQVALADWYARRGDATGSATLCDRARAALDGVIAAADRSQDIDALGEVTVARGAAKAYVGEPMVALGLYAAGAVDAVTAKGPLPQYLGAVYGGTINEPAQQAQRVQGRTSAVETVDQVAPAYPE